MPMNIGFEWTRGRTYECGPSISNKAARVIRQVGRGSDAFRPLEIKRVSKPYLEFANLSGTPEQCIKFASTFGLLTLPARNGAEERLDFWQREIKKMKGSIAMFEATSDQPGGILRTVASRRVNAKMASIDVWLECPDPNARPVLIWKPRSLLDAMLLQLAQTIAGSGSIHVCKQCGNFFEAGSNEGRRSIAVFCSESCKNRHHYLKRVGK
jgi:hypothetical protein